MDPCFADTAFMSALSTNITLNEGLITWPSSYSSDNKPQTAYILYGSICTATGCGLPSAIYCCISLSILFTLICIFCLLLIANVKLFIPHNGSYLYRWRLDVYHVMFPSFYLVSMKHFQFVVYLTMIGC
eukprot:117008_1